MKTIFIIGGIGSGKSTVTRYFTEHGIPTLDLDSVGHNILTFVEAKDSLVKNFGEDILDEEGKIDRRKLAVKAFASPATTKLLTDITAPYIIDQMKKWTQDQSCAKHPFVVVEVSAFDGPRGHYGQLASSIISVTAPVDLRVARALGNGFDGVDVCRRMSRQATDVERRLWAQHVVENDSTPEKLEQQLDALWEELFYESSV